MNCGTNVFWNNLMPCPFTIPNYFGLFQIACARPKIDLQILLVPTFLSETKDDFHTVNSVLYRHKFFWNSNKCYSIFGLTQTIWTGKKHFETSRGSVVGSVFQKWGYAKALKYVHNSYVNIRVTSLEQLSVAEFSGE